MDQSPYWVRGVQTLLWSVILWDTNEGSDVHATVATFNAMAPDSVAIRPDADSALEQKGLSLLLDAMPTSARA